MRLSSKGFLVDPAGRLLLLDCADPGEPGLRWWELPGGGVEDGENEVDALVREVLEETGLSVDPTAVGPLVWTQDSTFTWRGERHVVRCHGRVVRVTELTATSPVLTDAEVGTILGQRWWTPSELTAYAGRTYPTGVATLLSRVLGGERVDEPFERWN
ncbi:MAG: NUDIX domain-containing protein [Frankiales bacterium]|nr:NUDIX domain-containing protein [Frankiales bacterium]